MGNSVSRKRRQILQEKVTSLTVYKRVLNASGGKSVNFLGIHHEAAVVTTKSGRMYMIEKGVNAADDINYPKRYRQGECRIVEVTRAQIQNWEKVKSKEYVTKTVTLENLLYVCGVQYNLLTDNCMSGANRMLKYVS